ncbi:NAD-dependent epimerase/dehydratase family protein [Aggregicoccus sp. 17bor-14]|uniref:NAD-dependent epimerase/dehydratase family protein n=1 Tax=Myxococcaceae TaxID=31 RepID=UPI00129D070A|nr:MULTISPECIES: NAD-dependent epimerase/dehydratase family protein [Myxococcaceae]MBF5046466.1 NAD-dependent epimerase/dehydratase family protein [Simulacricoccus sp. 17bor-14]MRI92183.1 NAD-dependent epimerase/dehydratase family protein [Aggregicoccus sp. 17bor-14]
MQVLVTGATGLIGNAIARVLRERGHHVRALVRDPARAQKVVPAGVELVRGDVTQPDTLPAAVAGARWVFHAAGLPEQWQPDARIFDRVNREGTRNVLQAALAARVQRVVYTSTMDVFGAPRGGTLVETQLDTVPKPTAYERSKVAAEAEAEKLRAQGLELVYVNPGAVYGPSPVHVGLNSIFLQVLQGKAPALPPGGVPVAYVDAVAEAHVVAAERGRPGERYLLADGHASIRELASAALLAAGRPDKPPPTLPAPVAKVFAAASAPLARLFGLRPLIAPGQLSFVMWDVRIDASKAQRELGYASVPLADGVKRTVESMRVQGLV